MFNRKTIIFFLLSGAALLVGAANHFLFPKADSPFYETNQITKNLAKEIEVIDEEANLLISSDKEEVWGNATHSFFLVDSITVLRWNRNEFLPDPVGLQEDFTIKLFQSSRGSFVVKKWKLKKNTFLISVLTIQEKYPVTNRYLATALNPLIFSNTDGDILAAFSADGYLIKWKDIDLFRVKYSLPSFQDPLKNLVTLILGWVALLFFLTGLYLLVNRIHHQRRYGSAFFTLLSGMILLRVTMITLDFPRGFSLLFIFDPLLFASSSLNPSIADLFFNTLAVLIVSGYFFFTYYRWNWLKYIPDVNNFVRYCLAATSLLVCYYCILFPFLFFETISHNSNISLDISQSIHFDLIRIMAFLSIIIGSISGFLFCHSFFKIALAFTKNSRLQFYGALIVASLVFLLSYKISEKDYLITLYSGGFFFLMLYASGLSHHLKRFSYSTFLYFFLAIVLLSLQGAFSIRRFVDEKKKNDQFRYGSNFLVDRDILGEYLLNEAVQRISNDPFIQSRMRTPFLSKSAVRQKINQVYLNAYFDRYDVKVYLYNASGEPYDNAAKEDFATLIKTFQQEANKTAYDGIYFIESESQESVKRYLAVLPIEQSIPAGFVVLDLSLKKIIPQNVFPELLVDNQFTNYFRNADFSYAFLLNKKLISSSGVFNYERDFSLDLLQQDDLYKNGVRSGGYTHIALEDVSGKVAVVSSVAYSSFNVLANFSFLLVMGLCFVLILLILYAIILRLKGDQLNYAARIQVYVYLAFLLPLLAVSITTLSLISRSVESDLQAEFLNKSKMLGDKLSISLDEFIQNGSSLKSEFESELLNLTKLANVDASVFSNTGKLIASSQPLIYQNQLVSGLIERDAWVRIIEGKENAFVKNDAIGKLNFNTSYSSLKSQKTGEQMGILSIPFFDSAHSLEKTQISIWSNILVIFVIVFLLFSILSFFIVNWLTFPLRFITRTLGRTTFSGENKPLEWKSNDEIGLMVSEYNKMLENLERSKVELARSQKESAWREIAKQIAHEINNPLTPMKLTLQRMEQAQLTNSLSKETTEKSLQTLLSQVEILSQIAFSFSAFARMPAPVLKKMDLYLVLKKVVDLHANYDSAIIHLHSFKNIFIHGDEQLLTRVFSNIILNALQSVEEGRAVKIEITTRNENNFCLITILDNGKGIEEEVKEKVFLPHFSTKKSGSGIGLAVAKQGIELSGGAIWFESKVGVGTSFFIRLSLFS